MIVYVESNFVLELALEQEQHGAAMTIRRWAAHNRITLAIPAFALVEPFWTIIRNKRELDALAEQLEGWVRQLKRSREHKYLRRPNLAEIAKSQRARLDKTVAELGKVARIIPLTSDILAKAFVYQQSQGLEVFDAIVYASVVADLRSPRPAEPACFLTRDEHFQPHKPELAKAGCCLIGSFENGVKHIRHAISKQRS